MNFTSGCMSYTFIKNRIFKNGIQLRIKTCFVRSSNWNTLSLSWLQIQQIYSITCIIYRQWCVFEKIFRMIFKSIFKSISKIFQTELPLFENENVIYEILNWIYFTVIITLGYGEMIPQLSFSEFGDQKVLRNFKTITSTLQNLPFLLLISLTISNWQRN